MSPNKIKNFFIVSESVVDRIRISLDPTLLDIGKEGQLLLKEDVYYQILKIVDEYVYPINVLDEFFIKGSSLTRQWKPNSDIDIYMVDTSLDDTQLEKIREKITKINDIPLYLEGTKHPLEFYLDNKKYDKDNADVIYDLISNKFIKYEEPPVLKLSNYWSKFLATISTMDISIGELRRDLIDANELFLYLKNASQKEIEDLLKDLGLKLNEIYKDLDVLVSHFNNIKDLRHLAFSKKMSAKELKKFKSKNLLPDNVIFKLTQKYYYLHLLSNLKKIMEEYEEDKENGFKVKNAIALVKEIEKHLVEFNKKISKY